MQGDGIMSYHCTLPQGHEAESRDPADPQPCYTVESARSVRIWQNWYQREGQRTATPLARMGMVIDCPSCGEPAMKVTDEGGTCENCGQTAEIQQDLDTVTEIGEQMLPGDDRLGVHADPDRDTEIREAAKAFSPLLVSDGCVAEHSPASNPGCVRAPVFESFKQRPEDQVLPDADESVPDDQSLVIEDIETRRRVGIQRYGQGHRPFNGRNTLQDAYEESIDSAVYLRSLLRAREATRGDLIEHLAHMLESYDDGTRVLSEVDPSLLAVMVAERVVDYVTLRIEEARVHIEDAERAKVPARQQEAERIREAMRVGPHKIDTEGSWVSLSYVLDVLDQISPAEGASEGNS